MTREAARTRLLYEGKAKKVFATDQPGVVIQEFKDDATAFNARKRGTIVGKGVVNNKVSERLFAVLEKSGVETHLLRRLNERDMLVREVAIVPLEVVVRNRVAGSLAKRLGLEEGAEIAPPVQEFYYKNDALGDPLITEDHIRLLAAADADTVAQIRKTALRVNEVLQPFFRERGMILVDFKLEFGFAQGRLLVADEISPDTCRFWDHRSGESMDKDRFRKDMGRIEETYQEVLRRVCSDPLPWGERGG